MFLRAYLSKGLCLAYESWPIGHNWKRLSPPVFGKGNTGKRSQYLDLHGYWFFCAQFTSFSGSNSAFYHVIPGIFLSWYPVCVTGSLSASALHTYFWKLTLSPPFMSVLRQIVQTKGDF